MSDDKSGDGSKKNDPAPSLMTPSPTKAGAVLTQSEIGRMTDLGLGRGIDATNARPWVEKSSFQVRHVAIESVIGTEEGGSAVSYQNEVTSVHNLQSNLKLSIAVPHSPVTIGVDADLSRETSTTRRSIGRKVVNRSITFRDDFEEVTTESGPARAVQEAEAADAYVKPLYMTSEEEAYRAVADSQSGSSFEARLAKWIMVRVIHRKRIDELNLISSGQPVPRERFSITGKPLRDLANFIHCSTNEERKAIVKDCQAFVYHFRITHYVSDVQLGASEYRVLDESEYFLQAGASGTLGIDGIANAALSSKYSNKLTNKASETKTIGKIAKDGTVGRGSYSEAVVGVKFRPITSLVTLRYLYLALRKALLDYMEDQADRSSGPFIISCNSDKLFWKVNVGNDYAVEATSDIQQASPFYVQPTDNPHPYDFVISYRGEKHDRDRTSSRPTLGTGLEQQPLEPMSRYLLSRVNIFGQNSGPLHMHYLAPESHSRLTLHGRLTKASHPVDLSKWVSGKELYFINCAQRTFKKDGYLCIKTQGRGLTARHITACVAKKSDHNDHDTWLLFRVIPLAYRSPAESDQADSHEEDSELEEYERCLRGEPPARTPHMAIPTSMASSPPGATIPMQHMAQAARQQPVPGGSMLHHPTIQGGEAGDS